MPRDLAPEQRTERAVERRDVEPGGPADHPAEAAQGDRVTVTPWLSDPDVDIYVGDALDVLRGLPDGSVDCCVTSPPYWGLRDYGTEGQLGLEATPDLYVAGMVAVFAEVRRVLADHGTLWLNIGDSYASGEVGRADAPAKAPGLSVTQKPRAERRITQRTGMKPKDLCGIPWRLAFALQADGWWLRSDIIWAKPNPMPESVTDRPTKAHEYVFLLSKRPSYWFDAEAVREQFEARPQQRLTDVRDQPLAAARRAAGVEQGNPQGGAHVSRFSVQEETLDGILVNGATSSLKTSKSTASKCPNPLNPSGRNVRSVWEIATQPYPEAHFATFPEELARRCILAGCPEWVCRTCGDPWIRNIERGESDYARLRREEGHTWNDMDAAGLARGVITKEGEGGQTRRANGTVPSLRAATRTDLGWRPLCECGASDVPEVLDNDVDTVEVRGAMPILRPHLEARPGVVLDPFLGSGTTAHVARKHGRRCVGIELNETYAQLAARRLQQLSLLAEGDVA